MNRENMRGFTLMELMVVVAVVGILASLAYPSYQEAVRKTKRAEGRAALMQLMQQEERFYSQNTRYIAFTSESTDPDEKKFKWFSGDNPATSAYEISASACSGEAIQNCVVVSAKPGTGKVNASYKDPACGELTLTSTGSKTASGGADYCWK